MIMPSNFGLTENPVDFSDELKLYVQNKFCSEQAKIHFTFEDEAYINSWENYCLKSTENGVFEIIKNCYPQFNFPIESGIDKSQVYVDAVLKGKTENIQLENNLKCKNLAGISLHIHKSIAGKVPVLTISDDQDFTEFVQCILYKNNPIFIPLSMGALLVNGINNWDRLRTLKKNWVENNPLGNWKEEFSKNVLSNPHLYKDKIIMLSTKPYSNVSASSLEISEVAWKSASHTIRLEHECTHLYTLKKYGCASNNLHDELIADYIGISKTFGSYNKLWMLTFMGLEEYPIYRRGARLENYLGSNGLSPENFEKIIVIIKNAIENISCFDTELGKIHSIKDQTGRIDALCETDLTKIADEKGANLLIQKYDEILLRN